MTLPIDEQVEEMNRRWPGFQVTARFNDVVTWRGTVQPIARKYEIRIVFGTRFFPKSRKYKLRNRTPRIEITSPGIVLHHPETDELVPHVYEFPVKGRPPKLCLYDPAIRDWSCDMVIADTLVPWACEWIACYEGWLATGKWTGGGRHPDNRIDAPISRGATSRATPDPHLTAFVARLMGTHCSRTLIDYAVARASDPCAYPLWWRAYTSKRASMHEYLQNAVPDKKNIWCSHESVGL